MKIRVFSFAVPLPLLIAGLFIDCVYISVSVSYFLLLARYVPNVAKMSI